MSAAIGLWLGGALMALFFAWILSHMQRTDARVRTERVSGLTPRPLQALVPGEVNATHGALGAKADALTCAAADESCVFYELTLTREGSVRGEASPPATVRQEQRYTEAVLEDGHAEAALALEGALFSLLAPEVTRQATWQDSEWLEDTWQDGGWSDREHRFVESLGAEARGELDAGKLTLRYRCLPVGGQVLAIGEVTREPNGALTLGSSARFQLELTASTLAEFQQSQQGAHRTMQRAARGFVALAVVLALLAGLTYAGVLG